MPAFKGGFKNQLRLLECWSKWLPVSLQEDESTILSEAENQILISYVFYLSNMHCSKTLAVNLGISQCSIHQPTTPLNRQA